MNMRMSTACATCRRAHKACDKQRPCSRCKERLLQCVEPERAKRGRPSVNRSTSEESSIVSSSNTSMFQFNNNPPRQQQQTLPYFEPRINTEKPILPPIRSLGILPPYFSNNENIDINNSC
jgi:hypothetical protein